MNLRKMNRLVQKLKEEVHSGKHKAQAARLAREFHELCEVNVHRLEQSAAMMENNNLVGAVQLANTSPPLMEVMAILNFDQVASWCDYCSKNDLPQPPRFDENSIKVLTHALRNEDEIGAGHPLSKEFARLMMDRKRVEAYDVLRTILEKDPGNQAATQAKPGLERGILELKSRQLYEALSESNNEQAIQIVEEVEDFPFFNAQHLDHWDKAKTLQVEDWLRKASTSISGNDWQTCSALLDNVSQARSEVTDLSLSERQEIFVRQATEWTKEKEAEWLLEQDYRNALKQLEMLLGNRENDRGMNTSLSLEMLREASRELNTRWQAVQDLEKPVPNGIQARVDRERSSLLWDIQEKEKSRMRVMVSAAAAFVVLCSILVLCMASYSSGKTLRANLKDSIKERKVQIADQYMDGVMLAGLKKLLVAGLGETMKEARSFIENEKEERGAVAELVGKLTKDMDGKFTSINLSQALAVKQFGEKLSSGTNKVEALAPEYRPEFQDKLAIVQNAWESHIEIKRVEIHGGYHDQLAKMEKIRTEKLQSFQGAEPVRKGLDEIKPLLAKWKKDTTTWGISVLKPSPTHLQRLTDIERVTTQFGSHLNAWDITLNEVEAKAAGAMLPEYLAALGRLQSNQLLQRTIEANLKTINNLPIDLNFVQRNLLIPSQLNNPRIFDLFDKLKTPFALRPSVPVSQAVLFLEDTITKNEEVNCDLYYIFSAPIADSSTKTYLHKSWKDNWKVYMKSTEPKFQFNKEMEMHVWRKAGGEKMLKYQKITIPASQPVGNIPHVTIVDEESSRYLGQKRLIRQSGIEDLFGGRTWDEDALACLDKLNKLVADDVKDGYIKKDIKLQPNGPVVPTSIKRTLNVGLVAYLANNLYELMDKQKGEWGLEWSPQAQKDRATLKKLRADKIKSGDWMVYELQDADEYKAFREHFDKASQISYVEEAKEYHALLRAVYNNGRGIKFVGYQRVEPGETEAWLKTAGLGPYIWGITPKKKIAIMYKRDMSGNYVRINMEASLGYNPLFSPTVDCDDLLNTFKQKMKDRDYSEFLPFLLKVLN